MQAVSDSLEPLLDLIDFGIILTDSEGAVLAANAVARETAAAWNLLSFTVETFGALPTLSHAAIVERVIEAAQVRRAATPVVLEVVLRVTHRPHPLLVTVVGLPLVATAYDLCQPSCVLFFRDQDHRPAARIGAALKQLGLTPAETELAEALLEGLTLDECCARLGRTKSTLRSRMKFVLAKAGVHRQSQLIALILKSAPQIRVAEIPLTRKRR
jgi:DNA-binding CsgD family transcriptional regulator